jgi:hypothetical protein
MSCVVFLVQKTYFSPLTCMKLRYLWLVSLFLNFLMGSICMMFGKNIILKDVEGSTSNCDVISRSVP